MGRIANDKLTLKQNQFCYNYLKYKGNACEAYRKTYDVTNTNNRTLGKEAGILRKLPKVAMAIENLQELERKKLEITIETQVQKLEDIYIAAKLKEEFTPAIAAVNSQSKHLGLISDIPTTNVNINMIEAEKQLRNVSPERRAAMLEILEGEFEEVE